MDNTYDVKDACKLLAETLAENGNTDINSVDNNADVNQSTEVSKPKKTLRSRRFSCITYIAPDQLYKWLKNNPWVQHWAYALHDSDVWTQEDEKKDSSHKAGTKKVSHTHVILYTYEAKSSSSIQKHFDKLARACNPDNPQNTKVQFCNDCGAQYRYLLHEDDPDKFQYQKEIRHADNHNYWKKLSFTDGLNDTKKNNGLAMVQDVLDGTPCRTMCERYGKEYIYHAKYIRSMAFAIEREEKQGHFDYDRTLIELILQDAPFYEIDKQKFFEIFDYIEKTVANDFGEKPLINFYSNAKK